MKYKSFKDSLSFLLDYGFKFNSDEKSYYNSNGSVELNHRNLDSNGNIYAICVTIDGLSNNINIENEYKNIYQKKKAKFFDMINVVVKNKLRNENSIYGLKIESRYYPQNRLKLLKQRIIERFGILNLSFDEFNISKIDFFKNIGLKKESDKLEGEYSIFRIKNPSHKMNIDLVYDLTNKVYLFWFGGYDFEEFETEYLSDDYIEDVIDKIGFILNDQVKIILMLKRSGGWLCDRCFDYSYVEYEGMIEDENQEFEKIYNDYKKNHLIKHRKTVQFYYWSFLDEISY